MAKEENISKELVVVKETKGKSVSSIGGSDFDSWPPEKQKEFFDVLSTGARRYFGGRIS